MVTPLEAVGAGNAATRIFMLVFQRRRYRFGLLYPQVKRVLEITAKVLDQNEDNTTLGRWRSLRGEEECWRWHSRSGDTLTSQYDDLSSRLRELRVYLPYRPVRVSPTREDLNEFKKEMLSLLSFIENDDLKGARKAYYDHDLDFRTPTILVVMMSIGAWNAVWWVLGLAFGWGYCLGVCS